MNSLPFRLWRACTAAALILSLASCGMIYDDLEPCPPPAEEQISIRLEPEFGPMPYFTTVYYGVDADGNPTRSEADGLDLRYRLMIYSESQFVKDGVSLDVPIGAPLRQETFSISVARAKDYTIPLELSPGDYRAVAWADYVPQGSSEDFYYNTASLTDITLKHYDNSRVPGNTTALDVFRGVTRFSVGTQSETITLPMERPQARFRFISTDLGEFLSRIADGRPAEEILSGYSVVIRYAGYMPYVYNVFTDRGVDSLPGAWFEADIRRMEDNQAEALLGFDDVFVSSTETSVQLAVEVYDKATGDKVGGTGSINVPLLRGRTTDIRGRFLTTDASSGVGINPDFDGEYNVEVF